MRLALPLRLRLLLLWLFMLGVSGALAFIVRDVYQLGAKAQTERTLDLAKQACATLQTEYPRSSTADDGEPDEDLMRALLNLVLGDLPGIEGGFWHDDEEFVAYAYPTHQGAEAKRDVPSTEKGRIEEIVRRSLAQHAPVTDVRALSRETIVLTAGPVGPPGTRLCAWTMSRVPTSTGRAYEGVNRGLALLLGFVLVSGLWLGHGFHRWSDHFGRIERELAQGDVVGGREIAPTGDAELDRMVLAINRFRARLEAARTREAELGAELAGSERFATMGRMAAAVAHEVRNPIAAMRLKAENALAKSELSESALRFVVGEIERLDAMVAGLLSNSEQFRIARREVRIGDWIGERIAAFQDLANREGVTLTAQIELEVWDFDPMALGRALDNLVSNALAHTPRGGRIVVGASKSGDDHMILRVWDSGPGVAVEIEPRLFDAFVSGRADGVGLGLALVREIALAHGGWARYERRDGGSCFEVEVPWRAS